MNNNDTKYEIKNAENYLPYICDNTDLFMIKYFIIMNNFVNLYFENIYDNSSISPDKKYRYYIFCKGQEVLANIIKLLLISTNNLDLVLYHTHKAYYYYMEFISQLETDNNQLELNVKDAVIFVYKKTIFELQPSTNTDNYTNTDNNTNNTNNTDNTNNTNTDNYTDNQLKIDNVEKTMEIVNVFINIFILKDLLNNTVVYTPINDAENGSSLNNTMNSIFRNITKISKYYDNESEYNHLLCDYLTVMRPIMHEFNKINIINNENYNINDTVKFDLLLQLFEKIIVKIAGLQNLNYKVNVDYIDENGISDLTSGKIRDFVNNIMVLS